MSTVEATRQLQVTILPANVTAQCLQCGKPALAWVDTEQGRTCVCRDHARLALLHFTRAHGLT